MMRGIGAIRLISTAITCITTFRASQDSLTRTGADR